MSYRIGSRSEYVRHLQVALNCAAISCGLRQAPLTEDGVFGAKTEAAVRGFQTYSKLTADGIAGPLTLNALLLLSCAS